MRKRKEGTYNVAANSGANITAKELGQNVTIEERAQDQPLLFRVPGKVLLPGHIPVAVHNRAVLGHGHNGHRKINPERVHVEEAEESHQDHNVTLLPPKAPGERFTFRDFIAGKYSTKI